MKRLQMLARKRSVKLARETDRKLSRWVTELKKAPLLIYYKALEDTLRRVRSPFA